MLKIIVVDIQHGDTIVMSVNWHLSEHNMYHLGTLRIQKDQHDLIIPELKSLRARQLIIYKDDYLERHEVVSEPVKIKPISVNNLLKTFTPEQLVALLKGK